ncbi:MAG TPA: 1-acyl-sn-glycerol-3-phosphate acyltransferase [Thermoanaerobaculia bacterium]|nr:1-acyl-sn-glycerol-3-phosphate acyltransferase [Thermoanaerobaculia bacterium]HQP86469.1 1-acyl-sn-glycerol-3-phosphate acyltransferase [Thermoanaerobaculia bacterium]
MIRTLATAVSRLVLRVFYRNVEAAGLDRVPAAGPTILVLNHPNGLMDPLLLLCLSPRPVSFLAKSPLFTMPFVSLFVRAFDSIPVYRPQDADADVRRNRETFAKAREMLKRGGVLALFPEGVSHDEPRLMPLKSGAARIALGAAAEGAVTVVPAGLTYEARDLFRSSALLHVAEPFTVEPIPLDEKGEPPRTAVKALTERLREALEGATLQADDAATLELAAFAESLLPAGDGSLEARVAVRRLLLERAALLRDRAPERLAALVARLERFRAILTAARLAPGALDSGASRAELAASTLAALLVALFLAPPALLGLLAHAPAYNLVGPLAKRLSRGNTDIVATIKVLGAFLFFPLTWIALGTAAGLAWGLPLGLLTGLALPVLGYLALLLLERWEATVAALRALGLALVRRPALARLRAERESLVAEMAALDAECRV